jgi:hypothetical protein
MGFADAMRGYAFLVRRFCNEARNRNIYEVEGKTPEEIVAFKTQAISETRDAYREFWEQNVAGATGEQS